MLLSNSQLKPAIKLYEKHGFKSVPIKPEHAYERTDIEMELEL
jgi:ribosomal protein S18 acetylase RimI-like enzyme